MARKLFALFAISFSLVGCMGPEKGPSPVEGDLNNLGGSPAFENPAPVTKETKKSKKSKGRLPVNSSSQK